MADLLFKCPECSKHLAVDVVAQGKIVKCVDCGKRVQVPMSAIEFKCPSCSCDLSAPSDIAEEVFNCPNCDGELSIPTPASSPAGKPFLPSVETRQPSNPRSTYQAETEEAMSDERQAAYERLRKIRDQRASEEREEIRQTPEAAIPKPIQLPSKIVPPLHEQTKLCPFCRKEILTTAIKCKHCGEFLDIRPKQMSAKELPQQASPTLNEKNLVRCPKCGSSNIQAVTEGKTQGFGAGKGCCGAILLGPFGFLCGLCGMGKGKMQAVRMCLQCGKKF